jgi:hypothetical protein
LYDDASVHVYGVTDPTLGAFVTIHVAKTDRIEALTVDMAKELCENLTQWLAALRKRAQRGGNVVTPETPKGTKRRKR